MRMKQHRVQERAELALISSETTDPADRPCPLCGRRMIKGQSLNVHHLVPRMFGGRETALIHRVCHGKIHSVFSEAELAREYHTFERLRANDQIAKFIRWVRRQPPESISKHARPRRLK